MTQQRLNDFKFIFNLFKDDQFTIKQPHGEIFFVFERLNDMDTIQVACMGQYFVRVDQFLV